MADDLVRILEARLRESAIRWGYVLQLGQLAVAGADLSDLRGRAVELVGRALDVRDVSLVERDPATGGFVPTAATGVPESLVGSPVDFDAAQGHPLRTSNELVIARLGSEPSPEHLAPLRELGIVSAAIVVVRGKDRSEAVVGAYSPTERRFDEDDVRLLRAVGTIVVAVRDRDAAQHALADAQVRYREIVDSAPVGIVQTDPTGRIVAANPHMARIEGYGSVDELLEDRLLLAERYSDAAARAELSQRLTEEDSVRDFETQLRRRDGSPWWASLSLHPLHDADARHTGYVGILSDVTERREAALALAAAEAERREQLARMILSEEDQWGRFAADVHDDAMQLMAASHMLLDTLRLKLTDQRHIDAIEEADATLRQAVESLRSLIGDVLPQTLATTRVADAVRSWVASWDSDAPDVDVEDALGGEPVATALRTLLYRVVQEALRNVRRHSSARTARVRLERASEGILATVADDGVGFDVAAVSHGTGLPFLRGRSAVAGGWCRIESRPGQGTTVTVWLPVSE